MTAAIVIVVLLAMLAVAAGVLWRFLVARRNARGRARRGVLLQLKPSMELSLSAAEKKGKTVAVLEQFIDYIDGLQERMEDIEPSYSLEVHATGKGGYGVFVWSPVEQSRLMATTIGAKYELPYEVPAAKEPMAGLARALADDHGFSKNKRLFTGEYRLAAPSYFPIREWSSKDADDPMEAIYGIFDAFRETNGVAGFILTLKPAAKDWRQAGMDFAKSLEFGTTPTDTPAARLRSMGEPESGPAKKQSLDTYQKDSLEAVRAKTKQHAFEAVIRIYSSDWEIYQLLRRTVEQRFKGDYNGIRLVSTPVSLLDMAGRWFDRSDMVLTLGEIASVFHFPDSKTRGERLQRGASRSAMPPEGLPTIHENSRTDIFSLLDRIGV